MSNLDHERVSSIFAEAAALPAARWSAFLDSACMDEPDLRRELEELLACAHPASAAFDAASQQIVQPDPDRIGPYQLLAPIGEGGMAIVYKAQQHHPVRRTVAVKLIKMGMDTRQFVARFESERQTLAMMDHPNIAKVHDAGATETGRPYFVMEYVPGLPILEYCDGRHLSLRHRLELFIVVCEAVEHAHRKGIIHRDLKNSNVLIAEVDGRPLPKVIDFGVAKTISQPLTERTMFTEQGQLIGTPEYMSPEQAERGTIDIDTRSDVYSLGVLLYELISGVQPIPSDVWRSGSFEQVQRIIRESEPARPSTRLATLMSEDAMRVAQQRGMPVQTLFRELRSELEWIPIKAVRKDREQRYRSAAELADDIRNYLAGRPLIAVPESTAYKLRKFIRRHKTGVAASAAMVLLLVAGTVLYIRGIRAEQRKTEAQSEIATAVSEFLTERVFSNATPARLPDKTVRDVIVKAMLDPAAASVAQDFREKPLVEAAVRNSLAFSYHSIGRTDLALPHAQAALALRRRVLGDDHPDVLASINSMAFLLEAQGKLDHAEPLFREALKRYRRVLGDDHPDTLTSINNMGYLLESQGKLDQAEPLYREALEHRRRVLGDDHPDTLSSINNMGSLLKAQGKLNEAEPLYREALERCRRVLGDDHPDTLRSINNMGSLLESQGKLDQAEPLYREALERYRRVLGDDHPDTLSSINNMGSLLQAQGKLSEAEPLRREALERCRRVLGGDHPYTLTSMNNMGTLLCAQGKLSEAEPLYREALERSRRVLGDDHPDTLRAINNVGYVLQAQGKLSEADPFYREALTKTNANPNLGPKHPLTRRFGANHAIALDALGRHAEAAAVRKEFGLPAPTTRAATQPATAPR